MILIYITCENKEEAKKVSKHLLEKKLVACTNIYDITSMYSWKGKIEEGPEVVVIAKSVEENYKSIKEEVSKIHSYDIPCILKIDAEANREFDNWVKGKVNE